MMKCKKWEVWFARVKFDDSNEIKKRPVLIIGENRGLIISLKMTSQDARDSSDYPLKHWVKAGLDRETTIRVSKVCLLNDNDLAWKMGRISEYDILQVQRRFCHFVQKSTPVDEIT